MDVTQLKFENTYVEKSHSESFYLFVVMVTFQLENHFQPIQKNENSEQSSESLFRKRFESKLHTFYIKHLEVI